MQLKSKPHCPSCNKCLDGTTGVNGENILPPDGAISICIYCLGINRFNVNGEEVTLTAYTKEMLEEMKMNHPGDYEMITNYRIAIAHAKEKNNFSA